MDILNRDKRLTSKFCEWFARPETTTFLAFMFVFNLKFLFPFEVSSEPQKLLSMHYAESNCDFKSQLKAQAACVGNCPDQDESGWNLNRLTVTCEQGVIEGAAGWHHRAMDSMVIQEIKRMPIF